MSRKRHASKVYFYQTRGLWVASWYDKSGTRRYMLLRSATTLAEAEAAYQLKHGPPPEPKPGTIQAVIVSFERQVMTGYKPLTQSLYRQMFKLLGDAGIANTGDVRPEKMRAFVDELIAQGSGPANQHKLLRTAKRFFSWALAAGWITTVPTVQMPRVRKKSKGRPLTDEEFSLMLAATDMIYDLHNDRAEDAKRFLRGLWHGGLRISEMDVSWDDRFAFHVDWQSYKRPVFVMPDQYDKTGQDRVFPMTPEFWELIATVPEKQRHGPVFRIQPTRQGPERLTPDLASKLIARIGEIANVVVARTKRGDKFASAHDLRRSFGLRWSQRVNQMQLMALMRHSDPNTTAIYYLGTNAASMLESLWSQ